MEQINREIVVGYDGSPDAALALTWATATAAREDLAVRVVVVDDVDTSPWSEYRAESHDERAHDLELILKEAEAHGNTERHSGHVVPTLLEQARTATLLVVGSRGHGPVAETMLGSVSQHLARQASCPVVVVRQSPPTASRIVVGIDGSGHSASALEFACRRAESTGEVVVALHAWKIGSVLVGRDGRLPRSVATEIEGRELLLSESVAGVRAAHPDVTVLQEAIPVAPGQALIDASSTASLVVTGSRGRGAFAGMLLGSISHEVLQGAHCPVAVVR